MNEADAVFVFDPAAPLPSGWQPATLDSIILPDGVFCDGDWVESKDQDPAGDVRLIQLADVGVGEYRDRSDRFMTSMKAADLSCTYLKRGDILVARMPDPLGRACIFPGDRKPAVTVVDVAIVRPANPHVNPRWLMHRLNAVDFRHAVASLQSGSTRLRISRKNLARISFGLPPRSSQDAIVDEIEKQFSRLDEAVAGLQRVKANLKRYKAAVLKSAVAGRLVDTEADLARREGRSYETGAQLLQRILETRRSQWQGKGKYKEPAAPDTTDLPELPEGWVWASPEQLSAAQSYSLAIGPFGSSLKVSDYTAEGVPLVFVRNIRSESFGGAGTIFVSPEKAVELKAHWVESGDLLVTKMGDPPGDVCIYPPHRPAAVITADCIKVRMVLGLLSVQFFAYAIESESVHKQILGITKGVAQLKVSLGRFASIAFPVPPLSEQHRIVAEVDRLLSIAREAEAEVEANLRRAQGLRQAILARSFQPVPA